MAPSDEKRPDAGRNSSIDLRIAELAAGQYAIVNLAQLRALGLSASAVRSRVATRRLHRVHRGVYAVVAPSLLSQRGVWLAATNASGDGSALSHLACAALHGFRAAPARIDVSVPRSGGISLPGITIHRVRPFHPRDFGTVDSIPCTSLPRALLDIAPEIGVRGIERAIAEAQHLKIYDRADVEEIVGREGGRRGVGLLRTVLASHGIEQTRTNLELEERFLALARRASFPLPLCNSWVRAGAERFKCDFVWNDARLIVETDGRDAHTRDLQFEEDRRRDSILKLAGWEVVRFTWRQVVQRPEWVISIVRQLREQRLSGPAT